MAQQAPRPKIGLCLSGGGAKGMAHIGLLRMLDSLGIRPDYITGTSAGAILGGLYSLGYSGDELKQIVLNADWSALLSNQIPLRSINIEEKDEYGRYWLEMPIKNWKPNLPKGAIEGADLQGYLLGLTFSARHIHDFDYLPIPFRCMATDINTGRPVLLKNGQLSEALRASMAVPLVFSPVEWGDSLLLIDGGLTRNFPVQEVLDMGATTVIGSYTGFRLLSPDEIEGGYQIILQSLGLSLFKSMNSDKEACTVLINNELPGLYSSSFKDIRAIIAGGEANARAMLPELAKIAEWQTGKPSRQNWRDSLPLESIDAEGVNANMRNLLVHKMGIHPGQYYTEADLKRGLSTLYGTRFFEKIELGFDTVFEKQVHMIHIRGKSIPDGLIPPTYRKASRIHLRAKRVPLAVLKFGLHYDTDDASGVLLNTTLRNALLPNSRLSASFDIAERPKVHIDFYQFVDRNARLSWFVSGRSERTVRNDFLFLKSPDQKLQNRDLHFSNRFSAAAGLHYSLQKNALLSVEIRALRETLKPQHDPRNDPNPGDLSFLKSSSHGYSVVIGGLQNTLDAVYFPKNGQFFQVEAKAGFGYFSEFDTYAFADSTQSGQVNHVIAAEDQSYFQYRIAERYWFALNPQWSLGLRGDLGAGFSPGNKGADNPETFYIGGSDGAVRPEEAAFTGLKKSEINFSQFLSLGLSARYQFRKVYFITPTLQVGRFSDRHSSLYTQILDWGITRPLPSGVSGNLQSHIVGYGIDFGYQSKLGPVNLLLQSSTFSNTWGLYFSFGFKMP